jgi:hypothetical protein
MDIRGSFVSPLHALDGRLDGGAAFRVVRQASGLAGVAPPSSAPVPPMPRARSIFTPDDLAAMGEAAGGVGRLADRLAAVVERDRVHRLARRELRLLDGDMLLSETVAQLTVVNGGAA